VTVIAATVEEVPASAGLILNTVIRIKRTIIRIADRTRIASRMVAATGFVTAVNDPPAATAEPLTE
jgi:hypothetical protein